MSDSGYLIKTRHHLTDVFCEQLRPLQGSSTVTWARRVSSAFWPGGGDLQATALGALSLGYVSDRHWLSGNQPSRSLSVHLEWGSVQANHVICGTWCKIKTEGPLFKNDEEVQCGGSRALIQPRALPRVGPPVTAPCPCQPPYGRSTPWEHREWEFRRAGLWGLNLSASPHFSNLPSGYVNPVFLPSLSPQGMQAWQEQSTFSRAIKYKG